MGGALPGAIYVCPGFILSNQAWSLNGNLGAPVCGNGISRLSICGGSVGGGGGTGAVARSDNLVLGGSMGGKPPYPTGRLSETAMFLKLALDGLNLTFRKPAPNRGANLGHVDICGAPMSPWYVPPGSKRYSLLRGVEGW